MLDVGGIPVIERIVQQVRQKWQVEPWVAVRSGQPFGLDMRYIYPADCRYIFNTIENTSWVWGDTTIVLMGDVYFSDYCLDTIKKSGAFAVGHSHEIYGIKFYQSEWPRLRRSINAARKHVEATGESKIWHVYRAWDHIPLSEHRHGKAYFILPDTDDSQDFDIPEKYQRWVNTHGVKV